MEDFEIRLWRALEEERLVNNTPDDHWSTPNQTTQDYSSSYGQQWDEAQFEDHEMFQDNAPVPEASVAPETCVVPACVVPEASVVPEDSVVPYNGNTQGGAFLLETSLSQHNNIGTNTHIPMTNPTQYNYNYEDSTIMSETKLVESTASQGNTSVLTTNLAEYNTEIESQIDMLRLKIVSNNQNGIWMKHKIQMNEIRMQEIEAELASGRAFDQYSSSPDKSAKNGPEMQIAGTIDTTETTGPIDPKLESANGIDLMDTDTVDPGMEGIDISDTTGWAVEDFTKAILRLQGRVAKIQDEQAGVIKKLKDNTDLMCGIHEELHRRAVKGDEAAMGIKRGRQTKRRRAAKK